jgi:hypothetical protein
MCVRAINSSVGRWFSWFEHDDEQAEGLGSIPDEVIFLNLPNPSDRTRPRGLLSL